MCPDVCSSSAKSAKRPPGAHTPRAESVYCRPPPRTAPLRRRKVDPFVPVMLDEIHEQPDAFARAISLEAQSAAAIAEDAKRRGVGLVMLAARGSSDNAAIFGKYLIQIQNSLPVCLASPSVFTCYGARMDLSRALVVGISQSGEAPDVTQVLLRASEMGALTVAITNTEGSPLASAADHVLLCRAGQERSVAATKTFMNSLAAIYLLSAALGGHDSSLAGDLRTLPDSMRAVLSLSDAIASKVDRYRYLQECVVISRGLNLTTALEAALKLTETCYLVAEPYSASDFQHGPIAMVDDGFCCILFAPDGVCLPDMRQMVHRLKERRAEVVAFSADDEVLAAATIGFRMPPGIPEILSPPLYVLAGQLFACHLSVARGLDPDSPRGLRKVTRTW